MASLNNEQLDDPLIFDATPNFAGGMASNRPAAALTPTQYLLGVNVDIKTTLAVTRRGTSSIGSPSAGNRIQGLMWYSTPSVSYTLAVANGLLWKYNETSWSQVSGYTAAGGAAVQVAMAQVVNKVYIADQTTDLYSWDGTTLTDLGTGGANQPPQGNILISANYRLWMAGLTSVPDAVYASTPLLVGVGWDTTNLAMRVGSGDGDPIVGLCAWDSNQIVVFKRNSVWIVTADPSATATNLSSATVTKVTDTIGCVSARSIQVIGNDIFFLADSGVRSILQVIAQEQRQVSLALSEPINDVIQRINWTEAGKAAAAIWDNKYMLCVPLDDDTDPSTCLVYDVLQTAWSGEWIGWEATAWCLSKAGGLPRLNIGQADGSVLRWLDWVNVENEDDTTYQDAGVNVATQVTTRGMTFGDGSVNLSSQGVGFTDGFSPKTAFSVEAAFFQSDASAEVTLAFDQGQELPLASSVDTSGGAPLLLPFMLPGIVNAVQVRRRIFPARQFNPFRELQIVVRSEAGKLAVRGLAASAFSETVLPEEN